MIQVIFFALLILTLLAGVFTSFNPSPKQLNPLGFMMNNSGINSVETSNTKRSQQINMSTTQGLTQIRKQMDDLAVRQSSFMDMVKDQQQIVNNASADARGVLDEAQKQGLADKDILQLQALTSDIQDKQRLLVDRGQYLVSLNDELTKNRKWMADQIDLANINTSSSRQALQQHYDQLQNQANGYFNNVNQYNQEVTNQMNEIGDRFDNIANNTPFSSYVQQQAVKDRIERMLDRVHQQMQMVADVQQRNKDSMQAAKDSLEASHDRLQASMQRTQDLIDEEREKQEEHQLSVPQNNP